MRKAVMLMAALAGASPAAAEVAAVSDHGFVSRHTADVNVAPEKAWAAMLLPAQWWSKDHTYSGDAASLSLQALVGGCFCERLPGKAGAPDGQVEHMRVIHAAPHAVLRMQGGLGPLQSEAVTGVLTVSFKRQGEGTRITWEYVVGGYLRQPMKEMAPLVDAVLKEQFERLSNRLGPLGSSAPQVEF
jgi:hypothetical protein